MLRPRRSKPRNERFTRDQRSLTFERYLGKGVTLNITDPVILTELQQILFRSFDVIRFRS